MVNGSPAPYGPSFNQTGVPLHGASKVLDSPASRIVLTPTQGQSVRFLRLNPSPGHRDLPLATLSHLAPFPRPREKEVTLSGEGASFSIPDLPVTELEFGRTEEVVGHAAVFGLDVRFWNATGMHELETGTFSRQTAPFLLGNGDGQLIERTFAVLTLDQVPVRMEGIWRCWLTGLEVEGKALEASMPNVDFIQGLDRGRNATLLEIGGPLRVSGSYETNEWRLDGEPRFVMVDGQRITLAHPIDAAQVAATLGLMTLFLAAVKFVAGPIGGWIAGYTRAQPHSNARRRKLLAAIQCSPGLTIAEARVAIGAGRPTIMFHSRILAQHGLVLVQRIRNKLHFFPADAAPEKTHEQALLRNRARRDIYDLVHARAQPMGAKELASMLPRISRPLAAYHLRILCKNGVIHETSQGLYSARLRLGSVDHVEVLA